MKKIAIIDQGTNSSKLHIFACDENGSPREIMRKKAETRLGDEMAIRGDIIQEEPVLRTVAALRDFKETCSQHDVHSIEVVSTEVLRKAKNAQEVLERIIRDTGLHIKVLNQEQEAEMFWHGITLDFTWDRQIAAIDIGGGSVQFMYGTREKLQTHELLPLGTLFLRNTFITHDAATREEFEKIESYIQEAIAHITYTLPPDTPFIHGSSSVLNCYQEAGVALEPFTHSHSHPYLARLTHTRELYEKVRFLPQKERTHYFPSEPGFMDGLCPGLASVLFIGQKVGLTYELPSNYNIVSGIATLITRGMH